MAVFILGASRGIGSELAKTYTQAGWSVWGIGRSPKAEFQSADFHYAVIDGTEFSENSIPEMRDVVFSRIFLNAAVFGPVPQKSYDLSADKLNELFKINVLAQLRVFQCLFPRLVKSGDAKIAFIISKGGIQSQIKGHGALGYRVTKCAQIALALSLVDVCTANNVGLCLVNPGWVKTQLGGRNAPMLPSLSAEGIKEVVENLVRENWGKSFNYNGTSLPI
jgi:NADP-dependent 3-hydroxy acid dehydrogenase YdfG